MWLITSNRVRLFLSSSDIEDYLLRAQETPEPAPLLCLFSDVVTAIGYTLVQSRGYLDSTGDTSESEVYFESVLNSCITLYTTDSSLPKLRVSKFPISSLMTCQYKEHSTAE